MFTSAYASIILVHNGEIWRSRYADVLPTEDPLTESVLKGGELFWVEDGRLDPRFAQSPLVTGPPFLRFTVAVPVRLQDGSTPGVLSVSGLEPEPFDAHKAGRLKDLAAFVADEWTRAHTAAALAKSLRERDDALQRSERSEERLQRALELADIHKIELRNAKEAAEAATRAAFVEVRAHERAAEALSRSQQHLKHAQRIAKTGSVERDLTTGASVWSDELYRILGVERDFPQAFESLLTLVHQEDRTKLAASMRAVANLHPGEQINPDDYRIVRPDGDIRVIQPVWEVIFDGKGKPAHLIAALRDVTELRAAETRQREVEQQLLHSQKLEALGTLAGGVAHELNNTLVPILALTKLAVGRLGEGSRERDNLTTVLRASERARDLVQQILAFSRKETPNRQPVDAAALVREVLKMLRASLPATIHIAETIGAAPPVLADPGQLYQVVTNLVTNAAQAIGGRIGRIAIEVGTASGDRLAQARSSASLAFHLVVSDTGCGMDEDTLRRIFEPFFTTKPVGEGTGLGLAVVHGIVVDHGGRIAVESEPGRGTCVEVFLPALASSSNL